jgi:hypothetical protein
VLGGVLRGTAVGDDLDALLSCVGHRVMVPPRAWPPRKFGLPDASVSPAVKDGSGRTGTPYGALTSHGKS